MWVRSVVVAAIMTFSAAGCLMAADLIFRARVGAARIGTMSDLPEQPWTGADASIPDVDFAVGSIQEDSGPVPVTVAPDGEAPRHYVVGALTGGTLQRGGATYQEGDIIAAENAESGLSFAPARDFHGTALITLAAAMDRWGGGASPPATASLTVTHVIDNPNVSDVNSMAGAPVTITVRPHHADDPTAVGWFKITAITNGILTTKGGATVSDGTFVTTAEGAAGLIFTPSGSDGWFTVQAVAAAGAVDANLAASPVTVDINYVPCPADRLGCVEANPAATCQAVRDGNENGGMNITAAYWIRPMPAQTATLLYCKMEPDGTGWTIIAKNIGSISPGMSFSDGSGYNLDGLSYAHGGGGNVLGASFIDALVAATPNSVDGAVFRSIREETNGDRAFDVLIRRTDGGNPFDPVVIFPVEAQRWACRNYQEAGWQHFDHGVGLTDDGYTAIGDAVVWWDAAYSAPDPNFFSLNQVRLTTFFSDMEYVGLQLDPVDRLWFNETSNATYVPAQHPLLGNVCGGGGHIFSRSDQPDRQFQNIRWKFPETNNYGVWYVR